MKLRRFLRDVAILVAFCGAFYLLITFVNRLDGESSDEITDFSAAREQAESFVENQDWKSAAEEYRKLTEQDPYNGYAWERYATAYATLRYQAIQELEDLQKAGEPDTAKLDAARSRIRNYGDKSFEILAKLREFARFRGFALLRMAVISTYRKEYDRALELLQEFVDRGHNTQLGLKEYSQFGEGEEDILMPGSEVPENCRLHYFPKFWEIVEEERQNRANR